MASTSIFNNSMLWVQFKLRGGLRNILLIPFVFLVLIGSMILLTLSQMKNAADVNEALNVWTIVLAVIQATVLTLFGGGAVRNVIRTDLTERMIESHRLMPITGSEAVLGYMAGGGLQTMSLFVVTFLLGAVTSLGSQLPLFDWIFANIVLLVFTIFVWSAIALASFYTQAAVALIVVLVVVGVVSGGGPVSLVPGVMLLLGPAIGETVFGVLRGTGGWRPENAIAFLFQGAWAVLLFAGAARRFRRDDVPAFSPLLGMLLVATWVIMSVVGIGVWHDLSSSVMDDMSATAQTQVIGSIVTTILIGLIPLAVVAGQAEAYARRRRLSDVALESRLAVNMPPPMATQIVFAGMAVATMALLALAYTTVSRFAGFRTDLAVITEPIVRVGLVTILALWPIYYLLRILYRVTRKTGILLAVWGILFWVIPLILDFWYVLATTASRNSDIDFELGVISSFSPVGNLIMSVMPKETYNTNIGLLFMAGVAGAMTLLHWSTSPSARPHEARPAGIEVTNASS
jgi:hypothetical protein